MMPSPAPRLSPEEIRRAAAGEIRWLEDVAARHPSRAWPREPVVGEREFASLAGAASPDAERAAVFTVRLAQHIAGNRLKGMEPMLGRAEALAALARGRKKAGLEGPAFLG